MPLFVPVTVITGPGYLAPDSGTYRLALTVWDAARRVATDTAPDTPEDEVAFTPAITIDGAFSDSLEAPGPVRVWARACVGSACSTRSEEV